MEEGDQQEFDNSLFEICSQMALARVVAEKNKFLSDALFKEDMMQHPHLLIELLET